MRVKGIIDEDFQNFKHPSMYIAFPDCSFKCDKECGMPVCQNSTLATSPNIDIEPSKIVERYMKNPITKAIVLSGLEPFDSYQELRELVKLFRKETYDPIVIYTGYTEDEIKEKVSEISYERNIIIKFGRFIPNQPHKFDSILGVELASNNQYSVFYFVLEE